MPEWTEMSHIERSENKQGARLYFIFSLKQASVVQAPLRHRSVLDSDRSHNILPKRLICDLQVISSLTGIFPILEEHKQHFWKYI